MKKYEFTQDYDVWKKGDVIEQDMKIYHTVIHPLLMRGILKDTAMKKVTQVKDTTNLDLNNDGIFDEKDATIAGKVLAKKRYKNKKGVI